MPHLPTDGHVLVFGDFENTVHIYYDKSANSVVIDPSGVSDTNYNVEIQQGGAGWTLLRSDVIATTNGSLAFNKQIIVDTTAGSLTLTVAMMRAGILAWDPTGSSRTGTTPSAAELVADIPNAQVGTSYWFCLDNTGGSGEDITIQGGSGVTMQGTNVIGDGKAQMMLVTFTNVTASAEAVTIFGFGDVA